jgi:ribosomal protein L40E
MTPSDELRNAFARMSEELEQAFNVASKEVQEAFQIARNNIERTVYRTPVVCANCGEKNPASAVYCSKCGQKLSVPVSGQKQETQPP